jgi:hypothetical protein
MFPSIPELKPPVSSHEGPYLKARRLRQTKVTSRARRSSGSTTYAEFKVTRSAGPHERALPRKSIGSAVVSHVCLVVAELWFVSGFVGAVLQNVVVTPTVIIDGFIPQSDGETVRRSSTGGINGNGTYEEVLTLSSNKFSPTTYFKGIDCDGKTAHAETNNPLLKRRTRSVALHNNRSVVCTVLYHTRYCVVFAYVPTAVEC